MAKKMKKAGRNDPCPCGSGKKFKKCCETKMIRGRFSATPITAESAPQVQKAVGLASLFQSSIPVMRSTRQVPVEAPTPETPSIPVEAKLEENGNHLITS